MNNQNQNQNQNQARAIYAFRNNGTKAPISVMFEMETSQASGNLHNQVISRALGNPNKSRLTTLLSYTEDQFNLDFNVNGITADQVTTGYKGMDGQIIAMPLNFTTEELFGKSYGLCRIDTTDTDAVTNEKGDLKLQWSVKKVNGQELTYEGALIYTTVEFCEVGEESIRIKQDQDLSVKRVEENIPQASKVAVPF